MREILFKAKRIDNGEWVEGLLWKKKCKSNKIFISCFPDKDDNEEVYVVDENTICQYTGMTDKNGCKIWENDILLQKTTEKHWCSWECMGIVRYGEMDWSEEWLGHKSVGFYIEPIKRKGNTKRIHNGICQEYMIDEYYPIERIGNTFDNPELMNTTETIGYADNGGLMSAT